MKSKHFNIHELVPEHLYKSIHPYVLWNMMDSKLIQTIDNLKDWLPEGKMTINNYFWGHDRGWSGLRTVGSPYYSPTSQHTLGKAVDILFSEYNVNEIRDYIISNQNEFPYVGGLELGVSWLHIDVRKRTNGRIKTFYA